LFVKEDEGVYKFGTKNIFMKTEKDKLLVRHGAGYISIDEFMNLFQSKEFDQL
jgi:hypothetical protein